MELALLTKEFLHENPMELAAENAKRRNGDAP